MKSVEATESSAGEILARGRSVFLPALRDAIDSLPASMRRIAGYHFGWWDADGTPVEASGGKAIRPTLALLCAEAVGGAVEDAVPAAVSVELIHNFSLVHDDVFDGDETRRHRLTAWRVFGVANAILVGDAMLALSLDLVGGSDRFVAQSPVAGELTRTLCAAVQSLVEGQNRDVEFESRTDVGLEECLQMAEFKTGALLGCSCAVGALAGGGRPEQVDLLASFGARLGLAFQVADDLQGIWGHPESTGKPAYSDLRNRKKSIPVVAALRSDTPAGEELRTWYAGALDPSTADLERVADLIDDAGGRQWSEVKLAQLQIDADAYLRAAEPVARAAAELSELVELVTALKVQPRDPARTHTS